MDDDVDSVFDFEGEGGGEDGETGAATIR